MNTEEMLYKILEGKEKRAQFQKKLITEYKSTLISFTLNIPGMDKLSENFKKVHKTGVEELERELLKKNIAVQFKKLDSSSAGYEAFFCISENPVIIKKITTNIEERTKLGRLFDFDVFDKNYRLLSRTELGLPKRKCLLCDGVAAECSRSRKHPIEEVLNKVNHIIDENYN
ncbi:citrate lyase holo-[acyl-carrier protein] synthase [Clostridium hydrogenum]|uniref:citrate lyase holo-[acyl-carrier protein] synthase n=1 Tax=Clostridium hydrogenum TaxID=2855764 RepID=UPI001F386F8E|nr:citrate lyase holo-[acyl-carrier protein] synthase [Clostridium hydrogenum]